jgi:hypothetical protein
MWNRKKRLKKGQIRGKQCRERVGNRVARNEIMTGARDYSVRAGSRRVERWKMRE